MRAPPIWKIRRELWRLACWLRLALVRTAGIMNRVDCHGLTVLLNRSGMSPEVVMGIASGDYELPEIRGLERAVRPGDRILELGSGLGIVTALAARAASQEGRVLSFEANGAMIADTRDFLSRQGISNAEIRHAVLLPRSEPGETRDFKVDRVFAVSSLAGVDGRKPRDVIQVPALPINDVVAEFRPDVLICDIEGGEADLLPALDASKLRAAVVELHPKRLSPEQISGIYEALAGHGLHPDPEELGGTVVLFARKKAA